MVHKHFARTPNIYYTTKSMKELSGMQSNRQLDILVKSRRAPNAVPHDLRHVLVVGEHTVSTDIWK